MLQINTAKIFDDEKNASRYTDMIEKKVLRGSCNKSRKYLIEISTPKFVC